MSVYRSGDRRDDDKDDKKKKNPLEEAGAAMEKFGQNFAKGLDGIFGGHGKEKKWSKKGEGHTLGTAADAEAARQARLAALEASSGAASSSSAAAAPARRQQPSQETAARLAAAEARAAGRPTTPRSSAATAPTAPAPPSASGAFSGPGYSLKPAPTYDQEVALLAEMGFAKEAARAALARCNGDVERAIAALSEGGGGGGGGGGSAAAPPPVSSTTAATATSTSSSAPPAYSPAALIAASCATAAQIPQLSEGLSAVPGGGEALSLLRRLVGNVRDAPSEPKYRKVRISNAKIASAFRGRVEPLALLAAAGFTLDESGEHAEMGDERAADAAALGAAVAALDAAVAMAANGGPPVPLGPTDVKAMVALPDRPLRSMHDDVSDDFYALTPAEAKALMDASKARRDKEERFLTREQRDAERAKQRRAYRKALIRVRFPDDTFLQATFSSAAPLSALLEFVSGSLALPGTPFDLCVPPRGSPLGADDDLGATLEQAGLAPATLLNFRARGAPPQAGQPDRPYLTAELLDLIEAVHSEAIPIGEGGDGGAMGGAMGAMGALDSGGGGARRARGAAEGGKAPAWMRPQ